MKNIKVGLIFGGKSAEHAVSLVSAQAIYSQLDREKFTPVLLYINRKGEWCLTQKDDFLEASYSGESFHTFLPWEMMEIAKAEADIYFPVLHGPFGEDGRIQGLFEMAGKPFVGACSFSSALAMDKVVAKILFMRAGLKTADFLFFTEPNMEQICELVRKKLDYPVFVKPCSLGSSVGISKVRSENDLEKAVHAAFSYDSKILIERALDIREIEVSVMGNRQVMVSQPGELIPFEEFYTYDDKYIMNKTQFHIPAKLDEALVGEIKRIAKKAYRSLFLNGMARVDLFLEKKTDEIYVSELNTIPGFTRISMFPKLWEVEGISFSELLTRLIDYGFEYLQDQKNHLNVYEDSGR